MKLNTVPSFVRSTPFSFQEKKDSGTAVVTTLQHRPTTALDNGKNSMADDDNDGGILRLLLLGAAESGKTTLLEQIRMVHKQNFAEYELIHRRAFIYNNIMNSMKAIISNAHKNQYTLLPENEVSFILLFYFFFNYFLCFLEFLTF